jgi:hypothetical protein
MRLIYQDNPIENPKQLPTHPNTSQPIRYPMQCKHKAIDITCDQGEPFAAPGPPSISTNHPEKAEEQANAV